MRTLPVENQVTYVIGTPEGLTARPLQAFSKPVCVFLDELSAKLLADVNVRAMSDVVSFAWWCRASNIERLANSYNDGTIRVGRGLAFHVAPANMPVTFAFSWAFSLLAGNANIVRLPRRGLPQVSSILRHINEIIDEGAHFEIRKMNSFVAYDRDQQVTKALSEIADIRIIWGGDSTIQTIRQTQIRPHGLDVCFPDRYSICSLSASEVLRLNDSQLSRLANGFFNDAYIMDQNACSSPHLVIWIGEENESEAASERFWSAVQAQVERRYEMPTVRSMDKFTQACRDAIDLDRVTRLERGDGRLYRLRLSSPFAGIENRRGKSGYFYEWTTTQIDNVASIVTNKYQTMTYFGLSRDYLESFVLGNRLTGIDRIVPVGKAMDIDVIWDGYDLIRTLSRVCDIR